MIPTRAASALLLLAMLLTTTRASAFRTLANGGDETDPDARIVWAAGRFSPALNDAVPSGLLVSDVHDALRRSVAAWTSAECASVESPRITVTGDAALSGDDRPIVHALRYEWRERGLPGDVAATTDIVLEVDHRGHWWIVDADVLVNDNDFDWSTTPQTGTDGLRDLRAVLTHELGHVVGLRHPCGDPDLPACEGVPGSAQATMYPYYVGSSQSDLAGDDLAGICFLYPTTSCEEHACLANEACVEGECRPKCAGHVCAAGETCVAESCTAPPCVGDRCTPPPLACEQEPDGRACGDGAVGDPCALAGDCASGVCSIRGACAEPCGDRMPCAMGAMCISGACIPLTATFGDMCEHGEQCASGLCLEAGTDAFCTRECGTTCPVGYACANAGDRDVCAPPISSGCAAAPRGRQSFGITVPLGVLVACWSILAGRRRST